MPNRLPRIPRRRFLTTAALAAGAFLVTGRARPAVAEPVQGPKHLVWMWQFSSDGEPDKIGSRLRDHNLGIILKTHDGTEWMSRYDDSPYAVSGPAQAAILCGYYEAAAVPFHAWSVLQGVEPEVEAEMAAAVLEAGARSLYIDVDAEFGAWKGGPQEATRFGETLRRLRPEAEVILTVDTRPWQLRRLPLAELARFVNGIALKQFWRVYDTEEDRHAFEEEGLTVPPGPLMPEFLLAAAEPLVGPLGLPIQYVGEGDARSPEEFRGFLDMATKLGAPFVSVWRAGITGDDVYGLLRDNPPRPPSPSQEEEARSAPARPGPGQVIYVVQQGDTLSGIAARHDVKVEALIEANGLDDPDFLREGQELTIP